MDGKDNKKSNIIIDHNNGFNISKLQEKYGGNRKTIRRVLFNEGLINSIEPTRRCYFTGKEHENIGKKLLLRYESEKHLDFLCKEFNVPYMSVWKFLKKEGVFIPDTYQWRKYPVDEHFFDNIDTEEKAYFLGILYADGTNSLKKTEVKLNLQEADYEILKKLNNLLQSTKPILYKPSKIKNHKSQYAVIINSKNISYKLNELGMMPNKTFKLEYPLWLNNDLQRHFIRGYFDGDGGVTFNKINKQLAFGFTGTENMMLGIQNILINMCYLNKVKFTTRFPERNNNTRGLGYFGNGNSKKFYDFIYSDAKIFMKRKKDKFDNYLK